MASNEARARLGLPPKPGADSLLVQQQMVPLELQAQLKPEAAVPFQQQPPQPPKPDRSWRELVSDIERNLEATQNAA
jgi:hypothetical protein